jgi:hypothetical protein
MNYEYERLDGSTSQPDRQAGIDRFNTEGQGFVYLLSTRAGGRLTCTVHLCSHSPHHPPLLNHWCHHMRWEGSKQATGTHVVDAAACTSTL